MNDDNKEYLESYLSEVIASIINDKVERKVKPDTALMVEIRQRINSDVQDILNAMVSSGFLTFQRTLNDISFEFTPPK